MSRTVNPTAPKPLLNQPLPLISRGGLLVDPIPRVSSGGQVVQGAGRFSSRKTGKLQQQFLGANSGLFNKNVEEVKKHLGDLVKLAEAVGKLEAGYAYVIKDRQLPKSAVAGYRSALRAELDDLKKYYQGAIIGRTRPKDIVLFEINEFLIRFVNTNKLTVEQYFADANGKPALGRDGKPLKAPIVNASLVSPLITINGRSYTDASLIGKWFSALANEKGWYDANKNPAGWLQNSKVTNLATGKVRIVPVITSNETANLANSLGAGKGTSQKTKFNRKSAETIVRTTAEFNPAAFTQIEFISFIFNAAKLRDAQGQLVSITIAQVVKDNAGQIVRNETTGEVERVPVQGYETAFGEREAKKRALSTVWNLERWQNAKDKETASRERSKEAKQRIKAANAKDQVDFRKGLGLAEKKPKK